MAGGAVLTPVGSLRTGLELRLDAAGREWLRRALDAAGTSAGPAPAAGSAEDGGQGPAPAAPGPPPPAAPGSLPLWERHFAEAGRRTAAALVPPGAGAGRAADEARVLLLHAAGADTATVTRLYRHGTAAERRAVLLALPHLPVAAGPDALPLVEDALRTHDTRLIAAATGPYAAAWLEPHAWRHAVLKCLFTGVPLEAVAEFDERAAGDAELARMLTAHARERTAAGRPVPEALHRALRRATAPGPPGGPGD